MVRVSQNDGFQPGRPLFDLHLPGQPRQRVEHAAGGHPFDGRVLVVQ